MSGMSKRTPLSESETDSTMMLVCVPSALKQDFETFLELRGLYLSAPVRIEGEQDPEGSETRFIWPESLR